MRLFKGRRKEQGADVTRSSESSDKQAGLTPEEVVARVALEALQGAGTAAKRAGSKESATQTSTPEAESATTGSKFPFKSYLGQVLSGNILSKDEVQRRYPYILFMAFLMFLYIANGFHLQKLHRRHDRLTEQVKELRARSLTISSIRMISTRQSEVIRELELRGIPLEESLTPPKVIEK